MKLKLLILLILCSFLCFGQDSTQSSSYFQSADSNKVIENIKPVKKKSKKRSKPKTKPKPAKNSDSQFVKYSSSSSNAPTEKSSNIFPILIIISVVTVLCVVIYRRGYDVGNYKEEQRNRSLTPDDYWRRVLSRKDYYNQVYLKSEAWRIKREIVLRRDKGTCVHCGAVATQVHHKRYARWNIGKEPIEWLESVCKSCHELLHSN